MRCYVTSKAERLVYIMMTVPLLTSSCTLKSPCNNTQKLKYILLDRRARKIIKLNVHSIENLANPELFFLVKSCLCVGSVRYCVKSSGIKNYECKLLFVHLLYFIASLLSTCIFCFSYLSSRLI